MADSRFITLLFLWNNYCLFQKKQGLLPDFVSGKSPCLYLSKRRETVGFPVHNGYSVFEGGR